jgi:hypothetical protein
MLYEDYNLIVFFFLVFSVPTRVHAAYQIKALPHNIKKYILCMNVPDLPPLYEHEGITTDMKVVEA